MLKNDKNLKLRIHFELAIEIIIVCLIFIVFGLAFLITSNLLSFNWIAATLILVGLLLIYLRYSSYLEITNDWITIQHFKYFYRKDFAIQDIEKIVFYKENHLVKIHMVNNDILQFYLKQKNSERLMNYFVTNYPDIPCLIYDRYR